MPPLYHLGAFATNACMNRLWKDLYSYTNTDIHPARISKPKLPTPNRTE